MIINRKLWRFLCSFQFVVLIGLYTYLGLTPAPEKTVPIIYNDLFMHFSGYWVAAFSIVFAFPNLRYVQAALLLIIYSIGIETFQHFNPPRTFAVSDILANSMGVVTGLLTVNLARQYIPFMAQLINYASDVSHTNEENG